MRNMNYSPPLRYDLPKPKYTYINTINMMAPTNLVHQFQKSDRFSAINTQNVPKNNYNKQFSNTNIITNSPFLVRNYSTSFINHGNIHNLSLNQIYRTNSPATNTGPTAINNTQLDSNYNGIYLNKNNSVYSIFKNNNNNNILYSPQKGNNPNQNLIFNLKSNKSNQKLNFHPNLNGNIHTFFTPIPHPPYNNINSYNLTQPNIINNNINNGNNLGTIKKNLFQNVQTNNNNSNNKELKQKTNNILVDDNIKKDNRTIKSDEINSNLQTNEKPKENFDPNEF